MALFNEQSFLETSQGRLHVQRSLCRWRLSGELDGAIRESDQERPERGREDCMAGAPRTGEEASTVR